MRKCSRCGAYAFEGQSMCAVCLHRLDGKRQSVRQTPQERTRAAVYATGNKWAIENFNAVH